MMNEQEFKAALAEKGLDDKEVEMMWAGRPQSIELTQDMMDNVLHNLDATEEARKKHGMDAVDKMMEDIASELGITRENADPNNPVVVIIQRQHVHTEECSHSYGYDHRN